MGANKFIYASAVRIGALKFIATMSATKDVLALASAEFDVSAVEEGQTITVCIEFPSVARPSTTYAMHHIKHTGQVARQARLHPTPDGREIASSEAVSLDELRDPETDAAESNPPSGWWSWASARIYDVCQLPTPVIMAAGSAPATAPIMTLGPHPQGPGAPNLEIPPYKRTATQICGRPSDGSGLSRVRRIVSLLVCDGGRRSVPTSSRPSRPSSTARHGAFSAATLEDALAFLLAAGKRGRPALSASSFASAATSALGSLWAKRPPGARSPAHNTIFDGPVAERS